MLVLRRVPQHLADGRRRRDRRASATRASRSSPGTAPGSATRTRSTTPPAARCRRSWTATAREGHAAHLLRAPQQHLRAARQEPPDERVRGGHQRLPARPVQGRAPGRAVRRPAQVDDRRPGPGLRARGRAARDRGGPAIGVGDLGRLRRRRRGRRPGRRPPTPATSPNTRANLQGNRNKRFDAWIDSIRPRGGPR